MYYACSVGQTTHISTNSTLSYDNVGNVGKISNPYARVHSARFFHAIAMDENVQQIEIRSPSSLDCITCDPPVFHDNFL